MVRGIEHNVPQVYLKIFHLANLGIATLGCKLVILLWSEKESCEEEPPPHSIRSQPYHGGWTPRSVFHPGILVTTSDHIDRTVLPFRHIPFLAPGSPFAEDSGKENCVNSDKVQVHSSCRFDRLALCLPLMVLEFRVRQSNALGETRHPLPL